MSQPQNSYSNPAFCQQSEFYNSRCKSPPRFSSARQSPVGAQNVQNYNESQKYYEEQEFYEEMLVDDSGNVKQKKLVIMHNDSNLYVPQSPKNTQGTTYNNKGRYEYLPMQNVDPHRTLSPRRVQYHEEVEASTGHVHRYATIDEPLNNPSNSGRYALVPVEEVVDKTRYATVTPNHRYEYIQETSPPRKVIPRKPNPVATQKLHELLSTPKKQRVIRAPQGVPTISQNQSPLRGAVSPRQRSPAPKSQQKLNYSIGSRQPQDKRHMAVIAPMCSSPVGSVYSETTFSNKAESWMNLSQKKAPVERVLFVAAFMMMLCGCVTLGLDFYMISLMGRLYYLDFAILSGFVSSVLGLLGLRSRNVFWLPNRNYVLGYFFLIVLSLLTCVGLLVLLFLQPKPGTSLADMTSGAVCGMSVLSLFLAAVGVYATFCCILPPPDNRVEHSAPGIIL